MHYKSPEMGKNHTQKTRGGSLFALFQALQMTLIFVFWKKGAVFWFFGFSVFCFFGSVFWFFGFSFFGFLEFRLTTKIS